MRTGDYGMKLRLTAAFAGLVAGTLATSAMAEPVVAKLQAPTQGASKPVAGGAVFECLGEVCAARAPASDTAGLRGCTPVRGGVLGVSSSVVSPDGRYLYAVANVSNSLTVFNIAQ